MESTFPVRRCLSQQLPGCALLGALICASAAAFAAGGGTYGRVAGLVTDRQGNPLTDVSVVIAGPGITRHVERVLTDAHGRFAAEHLLPGRYSLRVAATNQLPVLKNGIEVDPGQTSQLSVILGTILPALRPEAGQGVVRSGDDWKWVLRTSASIRPVLRFRATPGDSKAPLEPSQKLIAMIPGSAGQDALRNDSGPGSVLAYWRPLSEDADLLVASSVAADGIADSSLVTSFRRRAVDGNPQELTLVVHQLSLSDGVQLPSAYGPASSGSAQGVVVSYVQTRQLSSALKLTSGFEIDYLNASRNAAAAQPRAELDYELNSASKITVRCGTVAPSGDGTLAQRVDELNAFPLVSLRDNAPRLETARHSEVAYRRHLGKKTELEVAAYHDGFRDAVVRGFGQPAAWGPWAAAGDVLPNATSNGVNLNAGDYGSSGLRASVSQSLGRYVELSALYANGDALAVTAAAARAEAPRNAFATIVRPRRAESAAAKLTARVPSSKTRIVASYAWVERGSVTAVDPYGLEDLNVAPYLGVQIRQPLPSISVLPGAHIEAVADFRNLAGEGYVRVASAGGEPLVLTPAYRSFRGGFSVQF
jgi:Carboxypeptidase regulatory-like domain